MLPAEPIGICASRARALAASPTVTPAVCAGVDSCARAKPIRGSRDKPGMTSEFGTKIPDHPQMRGKA